VRHMLGWEDRAMSAAFRAVCMERRTRRAVLSSGTTAVGRTPRGHSPGQVADALPPGVLPRLPPAR
jgi:hypothetical protein